MVNENPVRVARPIAAVKGTSDAVQFGGRERREDSRYTESDQSFTHSCSSVPESGADKENAPAGHANAEEY